MPPKGRKRKQSGNLPAPQQPTSPSNFQVVAAQSFSGPLPPPEILREYEDIREGFADRIITMAEKQTEHRIDIESYTVRADARRANGGVAAGLFVFLAFVAGSVFLIDGGHSTEGLITGLVPTGGMVSTFVYGTISRRKERQERMGALVSAQPARRR